MPRRKPERERYSEWCDRIFRAENLLRDKIEDWDRFINYYRLERWDEDMPNDMVWINYYFAFSRIILPSIYFRNPDIVISPRKPGPMELAICKVRERLLNYHIEEIGFEEEMRRVIFDAFWTGTGIMKFGYAPALRRKGKSAILDDLTFESIFEEADSYEVLDKMEFEPDDRVSDTLPFAIRVPRKHFLVDEMAVTLKDARWVIHVVPRPVEEVKASKRYSKGLTSGITGTHKASDVRYLNEAGNYTPSAARSSEPDLVLLYEIWDKETDTLMVLDSYNKDYGEKKFLREEDDPYSVEGFPFRTLIFNPDPEEFDGVSDMKTWENPTETVNFINTMHFNHIRRFQRKYLAPEGVLDEGAMEKLLNPDDGTVVVHQGHPGDVEPLQDAPMATDAYALRDIMKNELTMLTGVTEQRRGVSDKTKTATEASLMEQQARIRDNDRLYVVSKFVEQAAKILLQLDREFLTPDYVAFVRTPEEAQFWTNNFEEIWQSEVDVKVRVGSSAYISREIKTKQMIDLLNIAGQLIDPLSGMPVLNVREMIRRIGDNMDIDDLESLIVPPAPPLLPPGQPPLSNPPPNGGGVQSTSRRTGSPDLGDLMSGVQNLGVRRTPQTPEKV